MIAVVMTGYASRGVIEASSVKLPPSVPLVEGTAPARLVSISTA